MTDNNLQNIKLTEPISPPREKSIAHSAAIMGVATFLSRIAGLLRDQTFAFLFGAGIWTDAFNVAFRIPNLLRDLFAEGAMSAAFIPTFNAILQKRGKAEAFRLGNLTINVIFVVTGAISLLGIYFTPWLVRIFAPAFPANPEKFAVTVLMTRIMFPFLAAVSLAAITMGMLNSFGEYFIPSVAPAAFNFSMIIAGFIICPLVSRLGYPAIVGMAVGAMLGGVLQWMVQLPGLRKKGYSYSPVFNFFDRELLRVVKLIIPGTIGLAASQVNIAVVTVLATSQGVGPVSWLTYANRIMQLPLGLFGVAIAQATLPVFSRHAAGSNHKGMVDTLIDSIRLTAFVNIFSFACLLSLSEPVIRILFQHGRFGAEDTMSTALALKAYSVGLVFSALSRVLGPVFYALNRPKIPVFASAISMLANIGINLAIIDHLGYWGLALGTSAAAFINAMILYCMIAKKIPGIASTQLMVYLIKNVVVSAFAGLIMYMVFPGVQNQLAIYCSLAPESWLSALTALLIAILCGVTLLIILSTILGIPEAGRFSRIVLEKTGLGKLK